MLNSRYIPLKGLDVAIAVSTFGTLSDGTDVKLFALENSHGMRLELIDLGACITRLYARDTHGELRDVVLGLDCAESYLDNPVNLGATVGRCANRIGRARFSLDGVEYRLGVNNNANNLHSGPDYWFQRMWQATADEASNAVTFHLDSPDGDQGFPGAVSANVTYTLTENDEVIVEYAADPTAKTVINMTQHSYFNLNGHDAGSILDHMLQIDADRYTEVDSELIPTGALPSVEGTAMDFRTPQRIGARIDAPEARVAEFGGYDHNMCFSTPCGEVRRTITLVGDKSGIKMDVLTDTPGVQLYIGNTLHESRCKDGAAYGPHDALCLETQFYPDAINHADWSQPVFGPEHPYRSRTVFAFSTR